MIPDFSSWLYTTDEDFIEDRNLNEPGVLSGLKLAIFPPLPPELESLTHLD